MSYQQYLNNPDYEVKRNGDKIISIQKKRENYTKVDYSSKKNREDKIAGYSTHSFIFDDKGNYKEYTRGIRRAIDYGDVKHYSPYIKSETHYNDNGAPFYQRQNELRHKRSGSVVRLRKERRLSGDRVESYTNQDNEATKRFQSANAEREARRKEATIDDRRGASEVSILTKRQNSPEWEKDSRGNWKKTETINGKRRTRVIGGIAEGYKPSEEIGTAQPIYTREYEVEYGDIKTNVFMSDKFKAKLDSAIIEQKAQNALITKQNKDTRASEAPKKKGGSGAYISADSKGFNTPKIAEDTFIGGIWKGLDILGGKPLDNITNEYKDITALDKQLATGNGLAITASALAVTAEKTTHKALETPGALWRGAKWAWEVGQTPTDELAGKVGGDLSLIAGNIHNSLYSFGGKIKTNPIGASTDIASEVAIAYGVGGVARGFKVVGGVGSKAVKGANFEMKLKNMDKGKVGVDFELKAGEYSQTNLRGDRISDVKLKEINAPELPNYKDPLNYGEKTATFGKDTITAYDTMKGKRVKIDTDNIDYYQADKGRFKDWRTEQNPIRSDQIELSVGLEHQRNALRTPEFKAQATLEDLQFTKTNDFSLTAKANSNTPKIFKSKSGQLINAPLSNTIGVSEVPRQYRSPKLDVKLSGGSSKPLTNVPSVKLIPVPRTSGGGEEVSIVSSDYKQDGDLDLINIKPLNTPLREIRNASGKRGSIELERVKDLEIVDNTKLAPLPRIKDSVNYIDTTALENKTDDDNDIIIPPIIDDITDTKPDTDITTDLTGKQKQDLITIPRIRGFNDPFIDQPKPPKPNKPGDPINKLWRFKSDKKQSLSIGKAVKGYDVFVKEKGELVKANKKPLAFGKAKNLGMKITGETASASFKLEKSDSSIVPNSRRALKITGGEKAKPSQFYKNKKGFFVEKTKFRIDSIGEKKGISAKGLIAIGTSKKKKKKKNNNLGFGVGLKLKGGKRGKKIKLI